MQRLAVWVSSGVLAAGMSAAVLAGAAVAGADTDSAASPDTSVSAGGEPATKPESPKTTGTPEPSKASDTGSPATSAAETDPPKKKKKKKPVAQNAATAAGTAKPDTSTEPERKTAAPAASDTKAPATTATPAATAVARIVQGSKPGVTAAVVQQPAKPTATAAANPVKVIAKALTNLVNNVGSVALNALQALEKLFTGPPVLPPRSTVTVRTSTITLDSGQRVDANWYYPKGEQPPEHMILLQHGFLALGPMYSFTAANLAERTNSVVVTPSLPSNWFAGDDRWLGGTGMASQIADLFAGDRKALTQSALAAGYATRYDLDPAAATLPTEFALAGHSLGANLVSAAAGFMTKNGAAKDLVGVILLDGVPYDDTLSTALTKLDAYEAATEHYVPVRQIGAPPNAFNFISTVNQTLSTQRPDRFSGVVLQGGVHMDSMRGGNSLIQFVAYLVAGIPQAQNPPATEELAVSWLTDWFDHDTDNGDDLVRGSIIDITTPKGIAHGRVIGQPVTPVT